MRKIPFLLILILVCSSNLFIIVPAYAFPPLPSSFYGTIKVNGQDVPDGTIVEASINNQILVSAYSLIYEGDSVYSLDVPGDDINTPVVEGGQAGDSIIFLIGGVQAEQYGIWQGGTNVELNLTAQSDQSLSDPVITPTSVPSQTPIGFAGDTPDSVGLSSDTPTANPESGPSNIIFIIAGVGAIALVAGVVAWFTIRRK
jgi:hypothetical protein